MCNLGVKTYPNITKHAVLLRMYLLIHLFIQSLFIFKDQYKYKIEKRKTTDEHVNYITGT